jgi:hypothetical protein
VKVNAAIVLRKVRISARKALKQNLTAVRVQTVHLGPKAEKSNRRFGEDASSVITRKFVDTFNF